jgi:tetratricopeptide (TPR) repeat protein
MAENITDTQFHRIHLFIEEGQIEKALSALDGMELRKEEDRQEIAYLRAWCYSEQNHWNEAAQALLEAGANGETLSDIQAQGQTERRRRAHYQLLMGEVAVKMGHYEEAMRHYRRCIQFLDERRMNIPSVRVRALLAMGTLCVVTGFYDMALSHYEDALRLCSEDHQHPNLPDIYYGLCDLYRHKGNFLRALECGKRALELYTERKQQDMVGRMRNLLGRVCYQMRDFPAASTYYTEALALAMLDGSPVMALNNLVALADLRREEGELGEAWRYCSMALDYSSKLPPGNGHYSGMMYIVCGKVKEAEMEAASGQRIQELLAQAITFYEQAVESLKTTDARVALREAYQRLAQALETAGQQELAMANWKSAYSVSTPAEDSPFL